MARKSKYAVHEKAGVSVWKAALYVRLSREDGDKEESDSIANQKNLLSDFVTKMPDITIVGEYVDDGYTGTNFNRPGFGCMMDDIRSKEINCVVVKDLSRLGRNYIEVGNYIEQIFPFMDVRFISVVDMLDSVQNPAQMNTVMVPFKNLMNDEYCRDISNKVRSSLDMKRKQGQFIGSFASYGYQKDPVNKNLLIVDEKAADVVRDVFRWFLSGYSVLGIAKKLNGLGVPNPSAYKRRQGFNYKHPTIDTNDGLWPDSSVKRILTNRLYIGDMVQGKNKTKSYKVQRTVQIPKDDWIVVENTHEAIIDRDTFMAVQDLLGRDMRMSPTQDQLSLFSGLVRCADCGKAMNKKRISQPYGDYHYYLCSTFKKMSRGACTKHTIRNDKLEQMVLASIQKQIELAVSMEELIQMIESSPNAVRSSHRLASAVAEHTKERDKIEQYKRSLYEDWKNEDISREEYHSLKAQYDERASFLTGMINRFTTEQAMLQTRGVSENAFVASFRKHRNIECLTREIAIELIHMIYVHEGGHITIQFKFEDEYKKAIEYIENNRKTAEGIEVPA